MLEMTNLVSFRGQNLEFKVYYMHVLGETDGKFYRYWNCLVSRFVPQKKAKTNSGHDERGGHLFSTI